MHTQITTTPIGKEVKPYGAQVSDDKLEKLSYSLATEQPMRQMWHMACGYSFGCEYRCVHFALLLFSKGFCHSLDCGWGSAATTAQNSRSSFFPEGRIRYEIVISESRRFLQHAHFYTHEFHLYQPSLLQNDFKLKVEWLVDMCMSPLNLLFG